LEVRGYRRKVASIKLAWSSRTRGALRSQYKTSRKIAFRGGKQKFAALGLIHPIPSDCHGNAQAPGSESGKPADPRPKSV
jgi:hypothetical protein